MSKSRKASKRAAYGRSRRKTMWGGGGWREEELGETDGQSQFTQDFAGPGTGFRFGVKMQ